MVRISAHFDDLTVVNSDNNAAGRGADSTVGKMLSHRRRSTLVEE
jgi:hypothetical protein